jgi:hypothetical protein
LKRKPNKPIIPTSTRCARFVGILGRYVVQKVRVMKIVLFILLGSFCSTSFGNPVSGKVTYLGVDTKKSHFKRAGFVQFRLTDQNLGSKCAFLHIAPEDSSAINFVTQAYIHSLTVKVYFNEDGVAPWGIGSCAVKSIQLGSKTE